MNSNESGMFEKHKRSDMFLERAKKRRYTKWKLLELRKSKKCQEWPKVLSKRFMGVDGKWDPVGAFENNSFPQRTQSRDDIQHFYNDKYRKRQRDDYKYYWYGENTKRYNSYSSNHSHYFSNSKQHYEYDDEIVFESSRNRVSPVDYYPSYSYQMNKSRNIPEKDTNDVIPVDKKPEWFTGGPSNINETIELSGMSRELEAGILKSRKQSRRNDDNFTKSPESDENYVEYKNGDPAQLDSHLMKIIKKNAKEKDKRKHISSAKEVEKVLKSILLRPNEESKEATTLSQNSNGVVRTVNEIEANLKLKGNRGAGDMSAYYKLLGLVQNNFTINQSEVITQPTSNGKSINHSETSTNNNHPRQFTNSKYSHVNNSMNNIRSTTDQTEESEIDLKINENLAHESIVIESKDKVKDFVADPIVDPANITSSTNNSIKYDETLGAQADVKKTHAYNNFAAHANNTMRNERISMASRNVCNSLSGQFSNHMLGTGQNAYRWIRAMNNAAAASARITQINQSEFNINTENDNKNEQDLINQAADCTSMDSFNNTMDSSYRSTMEQANTNPQLGSYPNSYNYMTPGTPLFNQMSLKPFFPYNLGQNSLFGRQFLNPYLLQQLFLHKQWENRNISLQNQLRQFQSMIFNCNNTQSMNTGTTPTFNVPPNMPLNQGDCSPISVSK